MRRKPRLAILTIPTLGHFVADIVSRLPAVSGWEVRQFEVTDPASLNTAMRWADDQTCDSLWFEFCWPPFPTLIEQTDFGARRIIMRVHRIEATETAYVANMAWAKVHDVIVVGHDMRQRVLTAAPETALVTRLHVIPNGVDIERFDRRDVGDRFQIGWCGLMTLRKNPTLALQILHKLRMIDTRYRLKLCSMGCDNFAYETFAYLADQLGLAQAIRWDGLVTQADMPLWHSENGVLLHTSLHESFGYAIAEAAAVGCDVAVADHPGAHQTWPDAMIFRSVDQAVDLIQGASPGRWRGLIVQTYSVKSQIDRLSELLERFSFGVHRTA